MYAGQREARLFIGDSPASLGDLDESEWKAVSEFASLFDRAVGGDEAIAGDGSVSMTAANPLDVWHLKSETEPEMEPLRLLQDEWPAFEPEDEADESVRNSLADIFLLPLHELAWELSGLVYVGPIRTIPSRDYVPPATKEKYGHEYRDWPDGRGAWADLHHGSDEHLGLVSSWLSREDRLATGYGIRRRAPADDGETADLEHQSGQPRRLAFFDVASQIDLNPTDVGVGLSQLLPVVAAAANFDHRVVCIEQPELHVHPKVQVGLGDLFISAFVPNELRLALGGCGQCILETHSEHLLLRMLRRIRETSSGEIGTPEFSIRPDQIAVNFIEPGEQGMQVRRLHVDEEGDFSDRWPHGFFEERYGELF